MGFGSCRETCATTTSDASAILVTASGNGVLASDWSATTVVSTTFATWFDRTTANDVARRAGQRLAISTSAATNMGRKQFWFWPWRRRSTGYLADWLERERKRIQGWCRTIHGILGSRSDTEVGLPGTWSTIETLVTRDQFLAMADQISEDQICSGQ